MWQSTIIHRLFGYWKPYCGLGCPMMHFQWVASLKAFILRLLGYSRLEKRFCEVNNEYIAIFVQYFCEIVAKPWIAYECSQFLRLLDSISLT